MGNRHVVGAFLRRTWQRWSNDLAGVPNILTRLSSTRQRPVEFVPLDYCCAVAIDTRQRLSRLRADPYFSQESIMTTLYLSSS
jgi:hypothetical protein